MVSAQNHLSMAVGVYTSSGSYSCRAPVVKKLPLHLSGGRGEGGGGANLIISRWVDVYASVKTAGTFLKQTEFLDQAKHQHVFIETIGLLI